MIRARVLDWVVVLEWCAGSSGAVACFSRSRTLCSGLEELGVVSEVEIEGSRDAILTALAVEAAMECFGLEDVLTVAEDIIAKV